MRLYNPFITRKTRDINGWLGYDYMHKGMPFHARCGSRALAEFNTSHFGLFEAHYTYNYPNSQFTEPNVIKKKNFAFRHSNILFLYENHSYWRGASTHNGHGNVHHLIGLLSIR